MKLHPTDLPLLVLSASAALYLGLGDHPIGLDFQGGAVVTFAKPPFGEIPKGADPRRQVYDALDRMGLEGSVLFRGNEIEVQLAGVGDDTLSRLLEQVAPATLELLRVRPDPGGEPLNRTDRAALQAALAQRGPPREDGRVLIHEEQTRDGVRYRGLVADLEPVLTGVDLTEARAEPTEWGRTVVRVDFDEDAAARLQAHTRDHRGEEMALLIDGEVVMVARIQEPIPGHTMQIDLGQDGGPEDAVSLARRLQGASGVPLEPLHSTIIEPAGSSWLGQPLATLLGVVGLLALVLALALGRAPVIMSAAAGLAALPVAVAALMLLGGTLTAAVYPGALIAALPAVIAAASAGRGDARGGYGARLAAAWPGWISHAAVLFGGYFAYRLTTAFARGVSATVVFGTLAAALLSALAVGSLRGR